MIDCSEKRNRQLAFELQNSHVCEKRSIKLPLHNRRRVGDSSKISLDSGWFCSFYSETFQPHSSSSYTFFLGRQMLNPFG